MIIFYYKWIKEYNKIINVETHVTASNANLYVTASGFCVSMNLMVIWVLIQDATAIQRVILL